MSNFADLQLTMYLAVTYFFLVSSHYVPIDAILKWKLPHPVRLIFNYVNGTVGMLLPFCVWLYEHNYSEIIPVLVFFVIVAGLAPVSTHSLDAIISSRDGNREKSEHISVLEKHIDAKT
jgi:hypothetical protein